MRLTVWLIMGAMALYSGYWVVARAALEDTLTDWLEMRRAQGWTAQAALDVSGFPYRFETRVTNLDLADPQTGLGVRMPEFDLVAMALRPHQVLAFWPREQVISTFRGAITLRTEKMEGSLYFLPDRDLPVDRVALVLDQAFVSADTGWTAALDTGRLGISRVELEQEQDGALYRLGIETRNLALPQRARDMIDPTHALPPTVSHLRLDARASFERPWDLHALDETAPRITALDAIDLSGVWGDLALKATGNLVLDAEGFVEGELKISARNWREILSLMTNAGVVHPDFSGTIERALELMAEANGQTNDLDAPLTFHNGRIKFGPIPLGPGPQL